MGKDRRRGEKTATRDKCVRNRASARVACLWVRQVAGMISEGIKAMPPMALKGDPPAAMRQGKLFA
jgi:hypothetical protein